MAMDYKQNYEFILGIDTGKNVRTVREHYAALKAHGGDCVKCGACEKRCPFGVKIRENMQRAKAVFGY